MSVVYFIQAETGQIKIGYSSGSPVSRMLRIQPQSPVTLRCLGWIAAPRDFETRLHYRFAALRLHGEWFTPGERLLRFIERWTKPPEEWTIEATRRRRRVRVEVISCAPLPRGVRALTPQESRAMLAEFDRRKKQQARKVRTAKDRERRAARRTIEVEIV